MRLPTLCFAVACAATGAARADVPKMGGEMHHVLVTLYQKTVYVALERPDETPLTLSNYGERYQGAASVLDRSGYNAQFGWMANGFFSLPDDAAMWIESVDRSPGLRAYEQGDFAPILGTGGSASRWEWDGTMTHNWYAAYAIDDYHATYRVYVGTLDGGIYGGYTPGFVTLSWSYLRGGLQTGGGSFVGVEGVSNIPTPGVVCLFGVLGLIAPRRR